jgi:hypothetical protein
MFFMVINALKNKYLRNSFNELLFTDISPNNLKSS